MHAHPLNALHATCGTDQGECHQVWSHTIASCLLLLALLLRLGRPEDRGQLRFLALIGFGLDLLA